MTTIIGATSPPTNVGVIPMTTVIGTTSSSRCLSVDRRASQQKSGISDSNRQPHRPERCALPVELIPDTQYPHQELNLKLTLRRGLLYPFNYGDPPLFYQGPSNKRNLPKVTLSLRPHKSSTPSRSRTQKAHFYQKQIPIPSSQTGTLFPPPNLSVFHPASPIPLFFA